MQDFHTGLYLRLLTLGRLKFSPTKGCRALIIPSGCLAGLPFQTSPYLSSTSRVFSSSVQTPLFPSTMVSTSYRLTSDHVLTQHSSPSRRTHGKVLRLHRPPIPLRAVRRGPRLAMGLGERRRADGVRAQQHRHAAGDSGRAVGRRGGVVCPANTGYTTTELAAQLRDSGAKWVVTSEKLLRTAREAAREVGIPAERVILLGEGRIGGRRIGESLRTRTGFRGAEEAGVDPEKDAAYIVYSSVCCPPSSWLRHE